MDADETVQDACDLVLEDGGRERWTRQWRELLDAVEEVIELEDGRELRFPPRSRWIEEGGKLLASERECCSFFRLELVSRANAGPVLLRFRSEAALERGLDSVIADIFA